MKAFIPGTMISGAATAVMIAAFSSFGFAAPPREIAPEDPFFQGIHNDETAQFITDEKKEGRTPGKPDSVDKKPLFVMGLAGGVSNLEGMADVSIISFLGMQQGHYHFSGEPSLHYMRAFSLKNRKGLANLFRTRTSGTILEFSVPVKFSYSFLDLETHPYSPYLTAGFGYSHRRFMFNGSSAAGRLSRDFFTDALTLNYGFGFMAKITEQTRLQIGINGISYFDSRPGSFMYDTTGGSLSIGIMVLFY